MKNPKFSSWTCLLMEAVARRLRLLQPAPAITPTSAPVFGRFRPGTTADCASSCTDCGASHSGTRYSFTLGRIWLVLHS